jgi:AAA+ superfamily predicted ATPase
MNPNSTDAPEASAVAVPEVPDWYPGWAQELADFYFSGSACLFVLHGNVHDLIYCPPLTGADEFLSLGDFLATQLFGRWDVILSYDLGRGLRPLSGGQPKRLAKMVEYVSGRLGSRTLWPRDPDKVLATLDRLIQRNLLEEDSQRRKSIALMFDHAQYLIPAGDLTTLARGQASRLVRLKGWAQNPYLRRINTAIFLVADRLSEVSSRLVQDPHVATIEIPLPDETVRRRFVEKALAEHDQLRLGDLTPERLSRLASGLNLTSLEIVLARARRDRAPLSGSQFGELKKTMIERECKGLVNFLEPSHTLDMVVGHTAAKARLRQDAQWISQGQLDIAPMGYLVCGPVGTGKTFLAECYAGTIGIPCVVLRNFRSKYVGETEGNLQQVLTVLRSLGPVVVIIDEADAALGSRQAGGDSGTSARVFSMIARQMGNTRYRGRIIWMLLTSRPDLLPIDLKRQGRAEVHIPLFYPQEKEEIAKMFRVMAKKNHTELSEKAIPDVGVESGLSGADIEGIILSARRLALAEGRSAIEQADVRSAIDRFIPSAQGLEKELQELVAALECTDRAFLPAAWTEKIDAPGGRTAIQQRCLDIRRLIDA